MNIGAFTDKKQQPAENDVLAMIGLMLPLWQELIQFSRENYPADEVFKFLYGKKSLDSDWDEFVAECDKKGREELIEIYNTALERVK